MTLLLRRVSAGLEIDTIITTKYVEQGTWLNWSTILEVKIRRNEKGKPFIYEDLYLKYMFIEICASNQN